MNNSIFYNRDSISGVREFGLLAFPEEGISSIALIEITPCKSCLQRYTCISDDFSDFPSMGKMSSSKRKQI